MIPNRQKISSSLQSFLSMLLGLILLHCIQEPLDLFFAGKFFLQFAEDSYAAVIVQLGPQPTRFLHFFEEPQSPLSFCLFRQNLPLKIFRLFVGWLHFEHLRQQFLGFAKNSLREMLSGSLQPLSDYLGAVEFTLYLFFQLLRLSKSRIQL